MISSPWVRIAQNGLKNRPLICMNSRISHVIIPTLYRPYSTRPKGLKPDSLVSRGEKYLKSAFARPASWFNEIKKKYEKFSDKINNDSEWRNWYSVGMMILYTATALLGYRYLVETKYKATGEKNPYKQPEVEEEIIEGPVDAKDTTETYESMAREYDSKIWKEELFSYIWYFRRKLAKRVRGDALEVSCGTGRNIKYLDMDKIKSIVFVDSSRGMLEVAKTKFDKKNPDYKNVQWVQGHAEDLENIAEKSGQKFDTVFESFGLCSHEDPVAALKSFKKLLKKGGRVILLEHGRSYSKGLNKNMDKRAAKRMEEWGCRWNLDIDQIVRESGLTIEEEGRYHFGTMYFYVCK